MAINAISVIFILLWSSAPKWPEHINKKVGYTKRNNNHSSCFNFHTRTVNFDVFCADWTMINIYMMCILVHNSTVQFPRCSQWLLCEWGQQCVWTYPLTDFYACSMHVECGFVLFLLYLVMSPIFNWLKSLIIARQLRLTWLILPP